MAHITIAASARAFEKLFDLLRGNFSFSKSDTGNFGPFSASYSIHVRLADGNLQLNDDNTIEIQDLDVVADVLTLTLCFDLPGFCIPSFCIIPDPWNGCLVGFPGFCIGGPICATLDLSGVTAEITDLKASLAPQYFVDPARDPSWTDLDAELNSHSNQWRIFVNPVRVHLGPIDIPDTAANLLENAVRNAINNSFPSWLPDWAKDLIWAFIGPVLDLVAGILGIVGDIADWISNLLGNSFDLLGIIETAIAVYFASQNPIYTFEDPYPLLPASATLIPVKIPIRDLTAAINSREMIVQANVGV